jgi:GntR family transcriptional regulator, arabinose operon transcriptional repressor
MQLDPNASALKYLQVKDTITQYFEHEHYRVGQKIPSETELIAQLKVSRNTIRKALHELVAEGFIYKRHGSGSFFAGKSPQGAAHSYLIGVITPTIIYNIYPQIIHAINAVIRPKGYHVVFGDLLGRNTEELVCVEELLSKQIEGLIVELARGHIPLEESRTLQRLKTLSIPVVFIDWAIPDPDVSYVSANDVEGGFRATQYLLAAGHTRIACVYPHDHLSGIQRHAGYCNALQTAGVARDPRLEKIVPMRRWNDIADIQQCMQELLDLGAERPSAVFFFNDEAALRAYPVIYAAGLTIPADISVIGFDDADIAGTADVPLTTVAHPKYEIGKWAAEILFAAIDANGQATPKQLLITPKLVIRDSVKILNSTRKIGRS